MVRVTKLLIYLMWIERREKRTTINLSVEEVYYTTQLSHTLNYTLSPNKHTPQHHKKEEKQEAEGKV